MGNFQSLEVVDRGSETQPQVVENLNKKNWGDTGHLYPLQVENCDSNSRLVVDDDDIGKFRFERVKSRFCAILSLLSKSEPKKNPH